MNVRRWAAAWAALAGLMAAGVAGHAVAAGAHVIQPADVVNLRDVRDPQISPDGRSILYVVERRLASGGPNDASIWITPSHGGGGRPFILSDGSDAYPRWAPDGRSVAFLSGRKNPLDDVQPDKDDGGKTAGEPGPNGPFRFTAVDDKTPGKPLESITPTEDKPPARSRQLWLLPVDGGEATPLTGLHGDIIAFKWSPDGRRIAFVMTDPEPAAEEARKRDKADWVEVDKDYRFDRLWILDLDRHSVRRVSPAGLNVTDFDWSPDGRRLALRVADTPRINDYWYSCRLVVLDPERGSLGPALDEHVASTPLRWSPDGNRIVYARLGAGGIGETPRLYNLGAGRSWPLAAGFPGLVWQMAWAPDGASLWAETFQGVRAGFYRIDARPGAPSTATMTKVADVYANQPEFTLSRDGRTLAFLGEALDHPDEVWSLEGGRATALTDTNPQVAGWRQGQVREVSWANPHDGMKIYGVLVLPPDFRPGRPVKTVVQIHGGPEWAWWSGWLGSWHEWAQMLASHGYAVFLPNPRGSDGQGEAFARALGSDWGGADLQDILAGVDRLAAEGIVDPKRLGIGGWSYGGFMSAWAPAHTDRFKAAVVGAPAADLLPMTLTTDCPDFLPGYFGDPGTNVALYDAHSPVRFLADDHTPTLVLQGEADPRVPIDQGEEVYGRLKGLGREVEMVRYPREPHWFREMRHQQDVLTRVLDWYDRHL